MVAFYVLSSAQPLLRFYENFDSKGKNVVTIVFVARDKLSTGYSCLHQALKKIFSKQFCKHMKCIRKCLSKCFC